jgi:outer membrane autotransporter protein
VIQPYIRAAYVREFAKNNEVRVNRNVFNNDLSGSRGEWGAGFAMTVSDKVSLHADADYSNGDKIDQPWGFNVGARYSW